MPKAKGKYYKLPSSKHGVRREFCRWPESWDQWLVQQVVVLLFKVASADWRNKLIGVLWSSAKGRQTVDQTAGKEFGRKRFRCGPNEHWATKHPGNRGRRLLGCSKWSFVSRLKEVILLLSLALIYDVYCSLLPLSSKGWQQCLKT